ncbi:MAG: glycosyltransferase [Gemmatimonadetes bacterium]|nr:glycosyltransferase [Gemmatimonadota bacterium]MBT7859924.1 glycosyltransferase [Gemmatimonadota bacterium]
MTFDSVALLPQPELTSYLHQMLPIDGVQRFLICGTGFDAGVTPEGLRPANLENLAQLQGSAPADVLLLGEFTTPPTRQEVEAALQSLQSGGILVWLVPQTRSAAQLERLLHLRTDEGPPGLSTTVIAGLLEAHGFDVNLEASRLITCEPSAALQGIAAAVEAHHGDGAAILRDTSATHLLLVAQAPRRRQDGSGSADSRRAVHDAVSGAVASGVDLGREGEGASVDEGEVLDDPRVSIVIPVYNGAGLTEKCLFGIAGNTADEPNYEVIVVDNGSSDWTMYLLHAMEGDLRVLSNDRNLGFARACNQGAADARGEYVLFLNNDTVPHAEWLAAMVDVADSDPTIGVVGARLLYPDGTVQHAGIELVEGVPDHVLRGVAADDPRVTGQRDLDMVTGACLMIRRDLFAQIGGFDAQFVNGVEDVDLCLRARQQGYRVVYCGDAVVDHHEAQTMGRFDHVQENVRRFVERWGGHFDANGRLTLDSIPSAGRAQAPTAQTPTAQSPVARTPVAQALIDQTAIGQISDDQTSEDQISADVLTVSRLQGAASQITDRQVSVVDGQTSVAPRRINWEGSFFMYSSLAYVNRELVLALLAEGQCEMGLMPFEEDQFGAEEDPRFQDLAARMGHPLAGADVTIRHRWPPELERPDSARHVLMQPWEYGSVPRRWVEAVAEGQVDQIWAYTRYVRDCYVDGGVDPARVAIVPPGVDPDRFHPGLAPHGAVDTKAGFRFLFVGGTLYRKGIDLLLQAYSEEFSADEDVALVIKDMGVNTFYHQQTAGESIQQLQEDPACAEILYLTQDLPGDEIPRLYAAAHALVHPYRGEGFGLPVAEAMACGLPVIVTRGGASDDFCPEDVVYGIDSRRQAILFEGEETVGQAWQLEPDVASLRQQMRTVFESREDARRRGLRGSAHIHSHFTWADAAHKAQDALAALDALPEGVSGGETAEVAAIVLGKNGEATGTDDALGIVFGQHPRYVLDAQGGHVLGEQLDAIRVDLKSSCQLLFIFGHDVEVNPDDVRCLVGHFEADERLGLLIPERHSSARATMGDVPVAAVVDSPCCVLRRAALDDIAGFDTGFSTLAVLANVVRAMRRRDWRIATAPDVVVEEDPDAQVVALTRTSSSAEASHAQVQEMKAIQALEDGDRRRAGGDVEGAILRYDEALGAKPDFVEALLVLADAYLDADRPVEAAQIAARLPAIDSSSAWAHNFSALVHARAGDLDGARAGFATAVELNPDLTEARVNLAVMAWEAGEMETALEHFRHACERDPYNRDLICNLGLIYTQTGDTQEAVDLYRAFLGQAPDDVEVLGRLAEVQWQRQEHDEARDTATRVLQIDPDHARARMILQGAEPG